MKAIPDLIRRTLERSVLNPLNWAAWALVILAAWAGMQLLGWRVDTAVISGTADPTGGHAYWAMMRGVWYAGAYLGAVVVSPILLFAAVFFLVSAKVLTHNRHPA